MNTGPTYVTKLAEPDVFQTGVFFSQANMLSPVVFYPEFLGLNRKFQRLQDQHDLRQKVFQTWLSVAGPSSVGQYSLINECAAAVLARCDLFIRVATDEEAKEDFKNFGEQVTLKSEKEDPENEDNLPVIPFLGLKLYYTGPARLVMAIFSARVMNDLNPNEVTTRFANEVEGMAAQQKNDFSAYKSLNEGYFLLEAKNGAMHYTGFKDISDYRPDKRWFLGDLNQVGERLFFFPAGDRNSPIDFTENRYRNWV